MAKKRNATHPEPSSREQRTSVTPERFTRLNLLLTLLAKAPQARELLVRKLKLDVRGFYRDLEVLRQVGIDIVLAEGRYRLTEDLTPARGRLTFPDPLLSVAELTQLAKGRTAAHKRLQAILKSYLP